MLRQVIVWLTAVPGRKRGLAVVLAILAAFVRFADWSVDQACQAALLSGRLCAIDVGPAADLVEWLGQAVVQVLEPGVSFAAVMLGLIGLWHARQRARSAG